MQPTPARIVTHPGGAHKDDFLACAVLLARNPCSIERREPSPADIEDPTVALVDIGMLHDPERLLFDHHQWDPQTRLSCSLSLVLEALGLYTSARRYCAWLETTEWFDCRGPYQTARWLGVQPETLAQLTSPVDVTLIRQFSQYAQLGPGNVIWEVMRIIGNDLIEFITTMDQQVENLARTAAFWDLAPLGAAGKHAVFFDRASGVNEDGTRGLRYMLENAGLLDSAVLIISPDSRGSGYGIKRFEDRLTGDMRRIANEPDVHFCHQGGFIAKTSATDVQRLKTLVQACIVPTSNPA